MTKAIQNSTQENNYSLPRKIIGKVGSSLAWGLTTVVSIPFRALGSIARLVATPVVYGAATLTLAHIVIRPGPSKDIAKKILYAAPDTIRRAIHSAPSVYTKASEISQRVYNASMIFLGNKVCSESKTQYDAVEVAQGLLKNGIQLAKASRPHVVTALDALLTHTGNGLAAAHTYGKEKAFPEFTEQFNKMFPDPLSTPTLKGKTSEIGIALSQFHGQ